MNNLTQHQQSVPLEDREAKNGHSAAVLWFSGLSGSGKSTLAMAVQKVLFEAGFQVTVLDGDNVRHGLNAGLGFAESDRNENLRRVAEASKLIAEAGMIVLSSFISPLAKNRQLARKIVEPLNFFEIYVSVTLDTAEQRDPKGLYKKARAGEIKDFTGIDSPFEEPDHADLVIVNDSQSVQEGVQQIITFLKEKRIIS
ncbi:MAG: adenylyl-sulfate kinase [Candidatus Marinimicrobia bacterium]|nr:adenylyl-sulfate kinase [Candidatus Neomarinimicrobiota bacterium]